MSHIAPPSKEYLPPPHHDHIDHHMTHMSPPEKSYIPPEHMSHMSPPEKSYIPPDSMKSMHPPVEDYHPPEHMYKMHPPEKNYIPPPHMSHLVPPKQSYAVCPHFTLKEKAECPKIKPPNPKALEMENNIGKCHGKGARSSFAIRRRNPLPPHRELGRASHHL